MNGLKFVPVIILDYNWLDSKKKISAWPEKIHSVLQTNEQAWIIAQKIRHWVTGIPSLDLKRTAVIVQRSCWNGKGGDCLAQMVKEHIIVAIISVIKNTSLSTWRLSHKRRCVRSRKRVCLRSDGERTMTRSKGTLSTVFKVQLTHMLTIFTWWKTVELICVWDLSVVTLQSKSMTWSSFWSTWQMVLILVWNKNASHEHQGGIKPTFDLI